MPYTIEEHKHRFSAWAAGRAASANGCHFPVQDAKEIIEKAKLHKYLADPNSLPLPQDTDTQHRDWRENVIKEAENHGLTFTHGVAAKLINIYLKAGFVCGGYHDHANVKALHPPIDRVLLATLIAKDFGGKKQVWQEARAIGWTRFNSKEYEKVIINIRNSMPNHALWEVEQYWPGYL